MSLWEPFSERARRIIVLAQEEANRFSNNYVGDEHVLIAMLVESENKAAELLKKYGLTLNKARFELNNIVGHGLDGPTPPTFTPRLKKIIQIALDKARKLEQNYIGSEHLLYGILKENGHLINTILNNSNVNISELYEEVLKHLKSISTAETQFYKINLNFHKNSISSLIELIEKHPSTRPEKFLAINKLIEAEMWLQKAIDMENK